MKKYIKERRMKLSRSSHCNNCKKGGSVRNTLVGGARSYREVREQCSEKWWEESGILTRKRGDKSLVSNSSPHLTPDKQKASLLLGLCMIPLAPVHQLLHPTHVILVLSVRPNHYPSHTFSSPVPPASVMFSFPICKTYSTDDMIPHTITLVCYSSNSFLLKSQLFKQLIRSYFKLHTR